MEELTEKEIAKLRRQDRLREFANLSKRTTGLPVNIWVDVSQSYLQGRHAKRIKFQLNTGHSWVSMDPHEAACMDLEGNVIEKTIISKKVDISSKEIKAVSNFVKNNAEALSLMADGIIDTTEFSSFMIKGGELCTPEQKQAYLKSLERMVDDVEADIVKTELEKVRGRKENCERGSSRTYRERDF